MTVPACSGEGCPRCSHTGTCHLCTAALLDVVPEQLQQDLTLPHVQVTLADEPNPTAR